MQWMGGTSHLWCSVKMIETKTHFALVYVRVQDQFHWIPTRQIYSSLLFPCSEESPRCYTCTSWWRSLTELRCKARSTSWRVLCQWCFLSCPKLMQSCRWCELSFVCWKMFWLPLCFAKEPSDPFVLETTSPLMIDWGGYPKKAVGNFLPCLSHCSNSVMG